VFDEARQPDVLPRGWRLANVVSHGSHGDGCEDHGAQEAPKRSSGYVGAGSLRQRLQLSRRSNARFSLRNGRQTIAQVSHHAGENGPGLRQLAQRY
jgi:hypothetical protein